MKQLIQNWLNGKRNFTAGKLLYNQFGNDQKLKDLFSQGRSAYSEERLLNALKELAADLHKPQTDDYRPVMNEIMPDVPDKVLTALKNEWMPFYTEMNLKRHRIDHYLDDESEAAEIIRGKLAFEILDLEQKCMAVWAKKMYYEKHGRLPGKGLDREIVIDQFKAAERMKNLKIYVTRYKNYCSKDPGNARHAAKLKDYEKELAKLTKIHG